MDLSNIELFVEEEAVEVELRKGMSGNAMLSHWVRAFSKASNSIRHMAFVVFWLYTAVTTTPLTTFDERGITYLAANNARMDQDIPDDFTAILESTTSFRPFLRPSAFEFWSKYFTVVTILGSQREGLCIAAMHGCWQVMITSFGQELLGERGFSLIPSEGLHTIIFANPLLLLPTKSVVVYARKQSKFAIFEWQDKEKEWYLYAGEYLTGWEKKVKMVNFPVPAKKGSVSRTAKPKFLLET
ncbi:hypothetical protein SO802_021418 [Lithocarpus litseifolius]|uniref:Uncharacterized protein n=1 Tax=Lithocarpus litseifolius TaxID=425828 RepID=A0AAW2CF61_9ROSI